MVCKRWRSQLLYSVPFTHHQLPAHITAQHEASSLLGVLCLPKKSGTGFFQTFTFPNVTVLAKHWHLLRILCQVLEKYNTLHRPTGTAAWKVLKSNSFPALLRAISDKLNSNPFSKHS